MRHVRAEFSTDEVEAVVVSSIDTEQAIFDWIENTAVRVPIITDNASDLSCWEFSDGITSLYGHFLERTASSTIDTPFPMQLIIAPDGTLAYISREHHLDEIIEVLRSLVDASNAGD